jgi:hypothetical protein
MAGGNGFCLHPAALQAGQPRFIRAIAVKNRSHNQKLQRFFSIRLDARGQRQRSYETVATSLGFLMIKLAASAASSWVEP